MPLLYMTYTPNLYKGFILGRRRIRADVMEWVSARLPNGSRLVYIATFEIPYLGDFFFRTGGSFQDYLDHLERALE